MSKCVCVCAHARAFARVHVRVFVCVGRRTRAVLWDGFSDRPQAAFDLDVNELSTSVSPGIFSSLPLRTINYLESATRAERRYVASVLRIFSVAAVARPSRDDGQRCSHHSEARVGR